jgi:uncharacterized protein
MSVWALSDPHLALALPQKRMDVFGPHWVNYIEKMEVAWRGCVAPNDLVLIPGDISWASSLAEVKDDLEWIHNLPGEKVMLKGNHDYWWDSISKVQKALPPSLHVIQNNSYTWKDITIGGARMWDCDEYNFDPYIDYIPVPDEINLAPPQNEEEKHRVFTRELLRLEMSLKSLDPKAKTRIALTHYPPISADLEESTISKILEKYRIDYCVFGHLHNVKQGVKIFGERNGVHYFLTSSDYLNFTPLKLFTHG